MRAAAALVTAAVVAAVLVLSPARARAMSGTIVSASYRSAALAGRLRFAVYLPPDYATSSRRYPVVYFLHGLPASADGYRGSIAFAASALEQTGQEAIVVSPQGARAGDRDPEYLDWGPGRDWETAIATELPAYVDAHYRTIASRSGRALIGVSAGGYGAMILTLHHLAEFGAVESWSGYFHPTDPSGLHALPTGAETSAHTYVATLAARLAKLPTLIAFYVGDADDRFRAENVQLARELSRAKVPFTFRIYPGAHRQTFWDAHAVDWLELALGHLSAATP